MSAEKEDHDSIEAETVQPIKLELSTRIGQSIVLDGIIGFLRKSTAYELRSFLEPDDAKTEIPLKPEEIALEEERREIFDDLRIAAASLINHLGYNYNPYDLLTLGIYPLISDDQFEMWNKMQPKNNTENDILKFSTYFYGRKNLARESRNLPNSKPQ